MQEIRTSFTAPIVQCRAAEWQGNLICARCKNVLSDPAQIITCGHRYCRICIETHIGGTINFHPGTVVNIGDGACGPYTCCEENCQENFKRDDVFVDKGCQKDVDMLGKNNEVEQEHLQEHVQFATTSKEECYYQNDQTQCTLPADDSKHRRDSINEVLRQMREITCENEKLKKEKQFLEDKLTYHQGLISSWHQETTQASLSSLPQFCADLDTVEKQNDHEVIAKYGVFCWQVQNIRKRYQDALNGKNLSTYSPVFCISRKSYRLRLCIHFTGTHEGSTKGSDKNISIFFSILQSDNDDLLDWPFNQMVQLSLINYENEAHSITKSIIPGNSLSFQRPTHKLNIGIGFPAFASVAVLLDDSFIRDNTIQLQCRVTNAMKLL